MKKILTLAIGSAAYMAISPALAQTAPPYVPYTINEQQHRAFMTYLGEVPAKYAIPLINQFTKIESEAVASAAESKKEKTPDKAPGTK